jgi:hypothetical protein
MQRNRYAEKTSVPVDRSMSEIRSTLLRFKAEEFTYSERAEAIMVGFIIKGIPIRLQVPLPDPKAKQFTETPASRYYRDPPAAQKAYEQEVRRLWRSLANFIKATLDAVESGILTLEEGFLAYVVLPDGETLGQKTLPTLKEIAGSGRMPALLPGRNDG